MAQTELKMPKMGESITEGTIIDWMVKEGETFEEGDILLEVATDKVDNEVPANSAGVLVKTLFGPKDVVPVGEVIAILEMDGEVTQNSTDGHSKTEETKPSKISEKKTTKKRKEKPAAMVTSNAVRNSTFYSP